MMHNINGNSQRLLVIIAAIMDAILQLLARSQPTVVLPSYGGGPPSGPPPPTPGGQPSGKPPSTPGSGRP